MAIGSPSKRGALVPIDDMWDIVYEQGKEQAVYRSVYMYDEDAVNHIKSNQQNDLKYYSFFLNNLLDTTQPFLIDSSNML